MLACPQAKRPARNAQEPAGKGDVKIKLNSTPETLNSRQKDELKMLKSLLKKEKKDKKDKKSKKKKEGKVLILCPALFVFFFSFSRARE